jgi:hypothetical protein
MCGCVCTCVCLAVLVHSARAAGRSSRPVQAGAGGKKESAGRRSCGHPLGGPQLRLADHVCVLRFSARTLLCMLYCGRSCSYASVCFCFRGPCMLPCEPCFPVCTPLSVHAGTSCVCVCVCVSRVCACVCLCRCFVLCAGRRTQLAPSSCCGTSWQRVGRYWESSTQTPLALSAPWASCCERPTVWRRRSHCTTSGAHIMYHALAHAVFALALPLVLPSCVTSSATHKRVRHSDAAMQSCSHAVMQSCSHAVMQSCSHAVMQSCSPALSPCTWCPIVE